LDLDDRPFSVRQLSQPSISVAPPPVSQSFTFTDARVLRSTPAPSLETTRAHEKTPVTPISISSDIRVSHYCQLIPLCFRGRGISAFLVSRPRAFACCESLEITSCIVHSCLRISIHLSISDYVYDHSSFHQSSRADTILSTYPHTSVEGQVVVRDNLTPF